MHCLYHVLVWTNNKKKKKKKKTKRRIFTKCRNTKSGFQCNLQSKDNRYNNFAEDRKTTQHEHSLAYQLALAILQLAY
jgi:hypothetical protein